jgi:hypothetical protein
MQPKTDSYPRIFRIRQQFERPLVADVRAEVLNELARIQLNKRVQRGQSVAITAGSRGIANIAGIIRAAVDYFKSLGAKPFIIPAMGSHGGGTPEGQRRILADYGITEKSCGCAIRDRMATLIIDHTDEGVPVHFSREARKADHVLVVGRVKLHTELLGKFQSGLMKMMLIGLGKHEGAKVYHRAFHDYSLDQIVKSVGRRVIKKGRIVAGLGIVENAYDETAAIRAALPGDIETCEQELLALSQKWMPRLPFKQADILLIDEIGKDISGCGMDTNVVGRKYHEHRPARKEFPKITRIVVRGLTEKTKGNATGLGKSEFCLTRVVKQMDKHVTWVNVTTAGYPSVGMIPPHYDTDREVLGTALGTIGLVERPEARLLWMHHTLDVTEVECSEAYWPEAKRRNDLEVLTKPRPLPFDKKGNLPKTMAAVARR